MIFNRTIPALFTVANLIGGILAIVCTFSGRIDLAPLCLFASAVLDFLDGFVARMLNAQSEFGKQLDSLADMVTFGLAPGLMLYQLMKMSFWFGSGIPDAGGLRDFANINGLCELNSVAFSGLDICHNSVYHYLPFVTFLIPVFAMIRLAKFNIDTKQAKGFTGLPTPAMTIVVASIPVIICYPSVPFLSEKPELISVIVTPTMMCFLSVGLALLMVLPIRLFSLKFDHFRWLGNQMRYFFLIGCVALLVVFHFWGLPMIILFYLILSLFSKPLPHHEIQS